MFLRARLKLTAWYILITMLFTVVFSLAIYNETTLTISHLGHFLQMRHPTLFMQTNPENLTTIFDTASSHLRLILIIANGFVLIISGAAGYFLAGKTLKPIEENLEEQKRFVTDASHEFRTPLTALKTSIEVNMHDKEFKPSKTQDLLQRNLYQIDKLQELANRLLMLAQYQKGQRLEFSSFSLQSVLEEALVKVKSLAEAKHISIHSKIKDSLIEGEKTSLTELLTILLDNAIKYSHKNSSVTISNTISTNTTNIVIHDEGIGISQKDIPHIFDRFYRGDTSRTHNTISGFGLGLSIAKQIVAKHRGKISIISESEKGTDFIIELPRTN